MSDTQTTKQNQDQEKIKTKKVQITDYKMSTILGCGAFGQVRLAKSPEGKQLACKVLKKYDLIKSKQVDHVKNEIDIMTRFNHPFTVEQVGQNQDTKYFQILLEFIQGGELFTQLRAQERQTESRSRFFAVQVTLIFENLHSKDIVQRDLKPENMLINQDGFLKLTDFGFAKFCPDKTYTLCGTPQQIAPEIIMNKGHGKPVDWWALGILIQEMLHGIDPFDAADAMEIYSNILQGKIKFPRTFPSDAKSLVKHLVQGDLSKRQGALQNGSADVKNHRWYKDVNWQDYLDKKVDPGQRPKIKNAGDCSHFENWPETKEKVQKVDSNIDPFNDFE